MTKVELCWPKKKKKKNLKCETIKETIQLNHRLGGSLPLWTSEMQHVLLEHSNHSDCGALASQLRAGALHAGLHSSVAPRYFIPPLTMVFDILHLLFIQNLFIKIQLPADSSCLGRDWCFWETLRLFSPNQFKPWMTPGHGLNCVLPPGPYAEALTLTVTAWRQGP